MFFICTYYCCFPGILLQPDIRKPSITKGNNTKNTIKGTVMVIQLPGITEIVPAVKCASDQVKTGRGGMVMPVADGDGVTVETNYSFKAHVGISNNTSAVSLVIDGLPVFARCIFDF